MALELKKLAPVELRSVGLNEKWLQDQIRADTTILGLGELDIIGKEHKQQSGGRIDLAAMQARGIDASSRGASRVTFSITNKAIDDHLEMVVDELKKAEALSL